MFKPVVEAQREAASQITENMADLPATVPASHPFTTASTHYTTYRHRPLSSSTAAFAAQYADVGIFIGSSLVTFDGDNVFMDRVK